MQFSKKARIDVSALTRSLTFASLFTPERSRVMRFGFFSTAVKAFQSLSRFLSSLPASASDTTASVTSSRSTHDGRTLLSSSGAVSIIMRR